MNKKGVVGDATIIIISLIVIATLGIASFVIFGSDLFGENAEQIIKEKQQDKNISEMLFNFLKQDANYEGLNNLGLIMLYQYGKVDYEFVNNKFDEILGEKGCWVLQLDYDGERIHRFRKFDCDDKLNNRILFGWDTDKNIIKAKINLINYLRKVELSFAVVE
jgi:hypothetical protein